MMVVAAITEALVNVKANYKEVIVEQWKYGFVKGSQVCAYRDLALF